MSSDVIIVALIEAVPATIAAIAALLAARRARATHDAVKKLAADTDNGNT